jgi:antitoxin component YwqK of YwqJK toxin-antitoxin module
MEKCKDRCSKYFDDRNYVYKSCAGYVVVLKKTQNTITNENRKGIINVNCAKLRGDIFIVADIVPKSNDLKELTKITNTIFYGDVITYEIGSIVKSNGYNMNLDDIRTTGIHYFNTFEPAFYYNFIMTKGYTGDFIGYHDNGVVSATYRYKDGIIDGDCIAYCENGNIIGSKTYVNGKLQGESVAYYGNGRVKSVYYFTNGCVNGEHTEYYDNGQLRKKCCYNSVGQLQGKYVEYYENGILEQECNYSFANPYLSGKLHGKFTRYHANGKIYIDTMYKCGLQHGDYTEYLEDGELVRQVKFHNGNPS